MLTVAVCTGNRPRELRRALVSLVRQTPPPSEILVIDNAPVDDRTRELVEREFPDVRYQEEPMPGLGFARNRALSAALGDVVAFLDDDTEAAPGWAAALLKPFEEDRQVAAVAGSNGLRTRLPRELEQPMPSTGTLVGQVLDLGVSSLAVDRWRMLRLNGFDEKLVAGSALDAIWRLMAAGWVVVTEPAAQARQLQARGRRKARVAFLLKWLREARGPSRVGLLARLAWQLLPRRG
ncbi:MAG TPA: glycosyltransferase family A protein [Thermoanaerobaculia bacterium]|nr:glycosyltransferase family A protein [Thermoanaerobaculia bacterium]